MPASAFTIDPWTMLGSVSLVAASFIGLAVWLVKWSAKRQGEITDRHLNFLEGTLKNAKEDRAAHIGAMANITKEIKATSQAQTECNQRIVEQLGLHTEQIRLFGSELKDALSDGKYICRAPDPEPKPRPRKRSIGHA